MYSPDGEHLIHYIVRSLERMHPSAPQVFGLDQIELRTPEQVLGAIRSKFADGMQSYFFICFLLRLAADFAVRERQHGLLEKLLRLQELAGP